MPGLGIKVRICSAVQSKRREDDGRERGREEPEEEEAVSCTKR